MPVVESEVGATIDWGIPTQVGDRVGLRGKQKHECAMHRLRAEWGMVQSSVQIYASKKDRMRCTMTTGR